MKKEQLDLENRTVWIPDSKTPNGIAGVPLTEIAVDAFRQQSAHSGPGPFLFPSEENSGRPSEDVQDRLARDASPGEGSILSHLRSPIDIRHPAQRRRGCRRVGHAVASAGRCEGFQEVLANEVADEARGAGETQPPCERKRAGFWHSTGRISTGFWHSFGTVEAKKGRKRWDADQITLLESAGGLVGAGRFERPTPCAQGRCATRLRYAPTVATPLILPRRAGEILPGLPSSQRFRNVVRRGEPSRCEIATLA